MEGLAPPLELAISIRASIECGDSIRSGLIKYLSYSKSEMSPTVANWLNTFDRGVCTKNLLNELKSPYRRSLLAVLERGLKGQSILNQLKELEKEINYACGLEIEAYIALLPLKLLVPLLLFQFPAYLVLLIGPLIRQFLGALQ